MSVQATAWVLDRSESRGLDRLVLLVLANYADELDQSCPSGLTIAQDAGISTSSVADALRRLCDLGELQRLTTGSRGRSAVYQFATPIRRNSERPVAASSPRFPTQPRESLPAGARDATVAELEDRRLRRVAELEAECFPPEQSSIFGGV